MTTTTQSLHTALSARVTGRVVTGAAPGTCFQTGTAHRSEVTVAAGGPADVAAVLDVADRHGAPVTVHASGHGLRVPAAGGVLLDTSAMSGVGVDPATASARVGAGATWADVAAATAPHGLRAPSGSAPSVGVAGYLSGGGLGLAVRSDGWAADHVRSIEVVDRDGVREVTGGEVFTRLRGTGLRPGEVVTAVTIGLLPADPLTGGGLVTVLGPADEPGDPAPLHAWASWTAGLPDAVTSGVSVVPYPDLPFLPPHLRGRRVLRVRRHGHRDDRRGRPVARAAARGRRLGRRHGRSARSRRLRAGVCRAGVPARLPGRLRPRRRARPGRPRPGRDPHRPDGGDRDPAPRRGGGPGPAGPGLGAGPRRGVPGERPGPLRRRGGGPRHGPHGGDPPPPPLHRPVHRHPPRIPLRPRLTGPR
ncbi:putative oxidoreductase [Pseudonocardia sp. Ae168_Ps1]|nr:putative oxidoreductase [Pseudonocardia sp. Ae150A_Ps1]OLL78155.1 putative oxidoreductase [Pseudonocardia sp. Ae168_Ps1]OLL87722.1 putative oxidoreductase [Pseudonocardia sp. Ae263_Ps1]OLL92251.1 putative oxidoreductase [Pseudonocardia sp. Ae356_Ps1]